MKRFYYLLLVVFMLPVLAQAQLLSGQQNIEITSSPTFPDANERVIVSLNAYTFDTNGASISWYIDGVENTAAKNQRSASFVAGDLGEATNVTVNITLSSGAKLSASKAIVPSRVDLIIEANTLVPSFYEGRPLPSVGSIARAIAVTSTGKALNPANLSYLWKLDNNVMYGGAIKGKTVAEFEVGIGREQILSVDVSNNGQTIARKTIVVPRTDPEIVFYPENPLRGLTPIGLKKNHILTGEEVTVRAEPYYMSSNIFSTDFLAEWKINGQKITNPSLDPQYLTLRRNAGAGSANVEFHIRNLKQLVQGVYGNFSIRF